MPECRVIFENKLPDWWQATITNIGAQFSYKRADGTIIRNWATEKKVSLATNQTDQLNSDDPSACVGALLAAVSVHLQNKDVGKTWSDTVPLDQCADQWVITISPAQALTRENFVEAFSQEAISISGKSAGL